MTELELCVEHATFVFNYSTVPDQQKGKGLYFMIKSKHSEHLTMIISLPSYFKEPHSCAKISEVCNDQSISSTKKTCFFMKTISIFHSPSLLKQHQCFEPA